MRKTARRLTTLAAAVLLGGAITLTGIVPASAHDEFLSSYPAADATLGSAPAEITLSFTGELMADTQSAVIEVTGADGQNVAVDPPLVSGTTVTQHLQADPPDGLYTVTWKVVSEDGHPISGQYAFTIQPPATGTPSPAVAAPAGGETPASSPAPTATTDRGEPSGGGALLPVLAVVSGVMVVGAILVIVLMMGRERRRRDRADLQKVNGADTSAAKGSGKSADES
ncbi:MAG: copper resistance CopC family protein [Microbacterium sp.]